MPEGYQVAILAGPGFGDQKPFAVLGELGLGCVIRFRGNIRVADAAGQAKAAAEWVGKRGRARKLRDARITAQGRQVGAIVRAALPDRHRSFTGPQARSRAPPLESVRREPARLATTGGIMMPTRRAVALAAVTLAATLGSGAAPARAEQQITGAGSTFVYPVLSKWSAEYSKLNGVQVNYQSIGSGGGIAQIKAGTVDFGASDAPLSGDDLKAAGLAQFPIVIGGIVPVVKLEGVQTGQLKFTGAVLADIFLGKIKTWNDPAITRLNPGVTLPSSAITVIHRSDGSGTTFNFADYLSKVSPEWKTAVGRGTSIKWPTGIGGKGNEGVAAYVNQVKGSIGYVEYAYVVQNKMNYALLQNAAGTYVKPSSEAFQAAAASADWAHAQDFDLVMTNPPGQDAYPIAATTFMLMHLQPKTVANSRAALAFFKWSLEHGQQTAESLDYVPLPPALVSQIEGYWSKNIKEQ